VRAGVNCRLCELAIALSLLVVTNSVYMCAINPITNAKSADSHSVMWQHTSYKETSFHMSNIRCTDFPTKFVGTGRSGPRSHIFHSSLQLRFSFTCRNFTKLGMNDVQLKATLKPVFIWLVGLSSVRLCCVSSAHRTTADTLIPNGGAASGKVVFYGLDYNDLSHPKYSWELDMAPFSFEEFSNDWYS
jgi:hypothetical protein